MQLLEELWFQARAQKTFRHRVLYGLDGTSRRDVPLAV